MTTFACTSCDNTTSGEALPRDWITQHSAALGDLIRCPACVKTHAVMIATSNMSTEDILRAKPAEAVAGHNSGDAPLSFSADDVISGAAQTRLRTIVERIERLEEDKADIMADIKEVYDEAKGEGFDVKILRKVVSLRKMDKVKRDEEETILDLYLTAIGDR